MTDYNDRDNSTAWNQILEDTSLVFSILFIIECVLKIISMGFIAHYNSYLRDTWNWIDFTVVLVSILEMTPFMKANLKSLRTLRVLRPLRSIKALPAMRRLIKSLFSSIPSLSYAILFMSFVFLLFGILGVQQFGGVFY